MVPGALLILAAVTASFAQTAAPSFLFGMDYNEWGPINPGGSVRGLPPIAPAIFIS
jgi:hypothetical protein